MRKRFVVTLILTCIAAQAYGDAVTSIRVVLPPQPDPVIEKALQLFTRRVAERCDAKVTTAGQAPLTVEWAIQPGIGKEGFTIADGPAGSIRIVGNDAAGLMAGVGKFL